MVNKVLTEVGLNRIRTWLERDIGPRYAGSSVLLADREGDWFHAAGEARTGVPFARDTIVRIYSMTKPIVSLALAQAMERGQLHLDAPVSRFLPGWDDMRTVEGERCVTPTLHQLALHTSGLSYGIHEGEAGQAYRAAGIDFGPKGPDDLEAMTAKAAKMPLAFAPGTRWLYSISIDILGRVLEVVNGKPLDAILRDDIFDPLAMADTGFDVPEAKIDRLADCFVLKDGERRMFDRGVDSAWTKGRVKRFSGGGGLVSTIDDYMKFAACLAGWSDARLVSPSTLAFMKANHLDGDIASMGTPSFAEMPMRGTGFGLGGAVVLDPARMGTPGSIGDFGWGGMASTYFWCDPVRQLTCIFFTQLIPSSAYPQRAELKALVHGALA